ILKMKNRLVCIILILTCISMQAQNKNDSIPGEYYLRGVMETASVLLLKPDSSFEFFYSYGAVDRYGSGKWSILQNQLILNSRTRPPLDFRLAESALRNDTVITIQIEDKNTQLLSYLMGTVKTKSGTAPFETNSEGFAQIPKDEVISISLLFRLCPDRYSVFDITEKNLNFFKFKFEPWIAEVFFDHLILHLEKNSLRGEHPLLTGNQYYYVKENGGY
ncbi:MAG TPA: hypothetical protein VFV08_00945, partial [Puia sp.]|nr:hypothetical protein [Puia sp.]